MRAAYAIAALVLAGTTQAMAQPQAIVLPEALAIARGGTHLDTNSFQEISPNSLPRTWGLRDQSASAPHSLSLGPLSMDVGNADIIGRDGKRAHYAHIQLEGVHVFGGNISGNFDGRAATLHLNWHFGE